MGSTQRHQTHPHKTGQLRQGSAVVTTTCRLLSLLPSAACCLFQCNVRSNAPLAMPAAAACRPPRPTAAATYRKMTKVRDKSSAAAQLQVQYLSQQLMSCDLHVVQPAAEILLTHTLGGCNLSHPANTKSQLQSTLPQQPAKPKPATSKACRSSTTNHRSNKPCGHVQQKARQPTAQKIATVTPVRAGVLLLLPHAAAAAAAGCSVCPCN